MVTSIVGTFARSATVTNSVKHFPYVASARTRSYPTTVLTSVVRLPLLFVNSYKTPSVASRRRHSLISEGAPFRDAFVFFVLSRGVSFFAPYSGMPIAYPSLSQPIPAYLPLTTSGGFLFPERRLWPIPAYLFLTTSGCVLLGCLHFVPNLSQSISP